MNNFSDVIGHKPVIEYLQNALRLHKPSHAYIISGEDGSGKMLIASIFAAALECEAGGIEPCGHCKSCAQAVSGNHPDIVYVGHEKVSISVDDIREQINNNIEVKPYSSEYKIYIVNEAERMTEQAQNALLKTIEEPPEYAIICLLTNNLNSFLETIRSRCVCLQLMPLDTGLVEKYLIDMSIPEYIAADAAAFSSGNIGKAVKYATSEEFSQQKRAVIDLVSQVDNLQVAEIVKRITPITEDKNAISTFLDLLLLFFRDVLLFKATQDANSILYKQELQVIKKFTASRDFEGIEDILTAIDRAGSRLNANVNPELVLELLALTIKDSVAGPASRDY